jgi:cyclohexa-1,5-dienecarbonyl-CoA hydratase
MSARDDEAVTAADAPAGAPLDAGEGLSVEVLAEGQIWLVKLATPKANIIDQAKVEGLSRLFERAASERHLKAVVLAGEGPHFSFGASVEEHLPDACADMLARFHGLFGLMLDSHVTAVAAVQGQCLGGGLELAAFCHHVVAAPDAHLGQPEIVLGVLAPVASVALAERMGRGAAEDLCLTGRTVDGARAHALGLVDELSEDPTATALGWVREHLLPKSASSLRLAVRAVRAGYARRFREELADLERLYLDHLMATADAREGLDAFLARRTPVWSDS